MDPSEIVALCNALLEAYKNLDDWEEIVLEPQEIIVLPRSPTKR